MLSIVDCYWPEILCSSFYPEVGFITLHFESSLALQLALTSGM